MKTRERWLILLGAVLGSEYYRKEVVSTINSRSCSEHDIATVLSLIEQEKFIDVKSAMEGIGIKINDNLKVIDSILADLKRETLKHQYLEAASLLSICAKTQPESFIPKLKVIVEQLESSNYVSQEND